MPAKQASNSFPLVTKIGIFVIVLFGGSSIALVLSSDKSTAPSTVAVTKSVTPPKVSASAVSPVTPAVHKAVTSSPIAALPPRADVPSSSPLAAVIASDSVSVAPAVSAPVAAAGAIATGQTIKQVTSVPTAPAGTVPVQITVKVVTPTEGSASSEPTVIVEKPGYKAVNKTDVKKKVAQSKQMPQRKPVVAKQKPKVVVAKQAAPVAAPVAVTGASKLVTSSTTTASSPTTGSIKVVEKASDDFEFKKHAEVPITTPGKVVAVQAKPQYDVVAPAKPVKGPTPVLAKDNAVWVRVNGIRTVQVKVGEKVEGLGVYQGLTNGQPKFDGVVVPISN